MVSLTGGSPFHGNTYDDILWKNRNCQVNYNFIDFGQVISDSGIFFSKAYYHNILAVDLMKKMLAKNPQERISASEALAHPWILSGGICDSPPHDNPIHLTCVQENMRIFQQE